MAKDRIFISYSHKDERYYGDFLKHLRTVLGGDERLEIWSDQRIRASQDWDREIQAALEECAAAVLLVSADFLTSPYVRERELPLLLARRLQDEIALAPLFLRPCEADTPIRVEIPGREPAEIPLTQFQGLNQPRETLDALVDDHRHRYELMLLHAARQVRDLALRPGARRARPRPTAGQRRELWIDLERRGKDLLRTYSRPDWPDFAVVTDEADEALAEIDAWQPGDPPPSGESLFELLLGKGDSPSRILLDAFEIDAGPDAGPAPNPTYDALRIRLRTQESAFLALPWTRVEWEGQELRDHDWTVELTPLDDAGRAPDLTTVRLMLPGPVLCILPETIAGAKDANAHWQGLTDFFQETWPSFARPPTQAATAEEVRRALEREAPRLVYYFGPAETQFGGCRLLLADGQGGSTPLDVKTLAEWIPQPGTALVFLNLVGDDAAGAAPHLRPLATRVPLVIAQTTPRRDTFSARSAALGWLRELLTGQEQTDPVWALHRYGLPDAVAWSRYRDWYTELSRRPVEERLAELLLDRRSQRDRVAGLLDDLVRDRALRVCHLVAYGGPGNQVEVFPNQVLKHLKPLGARSGHVFLKDLRLPLTATTEAAIDQAYRRGFGLGQRELALSALAPRRRHRGGTPYVPLLVWKPEGKAEGERLGDVLRALVGWIVQNLARPALPEVRVLSLLALEVRASDVDTLEESAEDLLDDLELMDATFELEVLKALDHVGERDLQSFIRRQCNCPSTLHAELPRLIFRKTRGQFDETVALLDRTKAGDWYDLYEWLQHEHNDET